MILYFFILNMHVKYSDSSFVRTVAKACSDTNYISPENSFVVPGLHRSTNIFV